MYGTVVGATQTTTDQHAVDISNFSMLWPHLQLIVAIKKIVWTLFVLSLLIVYLC